MERKFHQVPGEINGLTEKANENAIEEKKLTANKARITHLDLEFRPENESRKSFALKNFLSRFSREERAEQKKVS